MRDLVVTENITLDGVIDASEGWFNPGDGSEADLSDLLAALEVQREHSTVLRGLDEVAALKAKPGKDIVTTGSIKLVHSLAAAGLVDEYRLFVYPVVVGKGARLFPVGTPPATLHPTETQPFRSGITLLRYHT